MDDQLDTKYLIFFIISITLVTILIFIIIKRRNKPTKPHEKHEENNRSIYEVRQNIEENNKINEGNTFEKDQDTYRPNNIPNFQKNHSTRVNRVEESNIYTDTSSNIPSNHESISQTISDRPDVDRDDLRQPNEYDGKNVDDNKEEYTISDNNISSNSSYHPESSTQTAPNYTEKASNNDDTFHEHDEKEEEPKFKPINSNINVNSHMIDHNNNDNHNQDNTNSSPNVNSKLDQILNRATKFTAQSTTNNISYATTDPNGDSTPVQHSSTSSYLSSVEEKYQKYLERSSTISSSLGTTNRSSFTSSTLTEKSDDPSVELYCKDYTLMSIISCDSPGTPSEIPLEKSLTGYFKTKIEKCSTVKFILRNGDLSTDEIEVTEPGEYYYFYGKLRKM